MRHIVARSHTMSFWTKCTLHGQIYGTESLSFVQVKLHLPFTKNIYTMNHVQVMVLQTTGTSSHVDILFDFEVRCCKANVYVNAMHNEYK